MCHSVVRYDEQYPIREGDGGLAVLDPERRPDLLHPCLQLRIAEAGEVGPEARPDHGEPAVRGHGHRVVGRLDAHGREARGRDGTGVDIVVQLCRGPGRVGTGEERVV